MPVAAKAPKYARLADTLREQLRNGALKPGDQLPSYVQARAQYGIGQGTLDHVYRLLENEGLIVRTPKQGVFVAEPSKRDRTNIIGILTNGERFPGDDEAPYGARILRGIQSVARREKVELLILHKDSALKWEKMDGLIQWHWPVMKIPACVPSVSLFNRAPGVLSVMTDDYSGIKAAIAHLMELGHRRIAFLTLGVSLDHDDSSDDRFRGYVDALNEAGIGFERRWTRPLREPWAGPGRFMDMGYNQTKQWLAEDWSDLNCTALLTQNDETALGAMRALREAGIDVPGQVSVVGFDGLGFAEMVSPSLTTLVVPLEQVGAEATRLLLEKITEKSPGPAAPPAEGQTLVLESRLRIGESTAPPPGHS